MTRMAPPRVRRAQSIRFNLGYDSAYVASHEPFAVGVDTDSVDNSTIHYLCTGVQNSIVDLDAASSLLKPLGLRKFEVAEVELRVIKRKMVK